MKPEHALKQRKEEVIFVPNVVEFAVRGQQKEYFILHLEEDKPGSVRITKISVGATVIVKSVRA